MKHLYLLSAGLVWLMIMAATPSLAATVSGGNTSTGNASVNSVNIDLNTTIVDQTNTTINSTSTFTFNLQTGDNQANANSGAGTAKSGSIAVELVGTNQPAVGPVTTTTHSSRQTTISTTTVDLAGQGSAIITDHPVSVTTENANTGANSVNTTTVNKGSTSSVSKKVVQTEINDLALNFNTGGNQTNFNTGSGTVESGSINVFVKKETLPPPPPLPLPVKPQPKPPVPVEEKPAPTVGKPAGEPAAQPQPQPTVVPTPVQQLKPILAEKLAQLVPSQPTQLAVAPAAQPTAPAPAPTPAAQLPKAGAEVPLLASLLSAGSLRAAYYLRRRRRKLLYRTKKPW